MNSICDVLKLNSKLVHVNNVLISPSVISPTQTPPKYRAYERQFAVD